MHKVIDTATMMKEMIFLLTAITVVMELARAGTVPKISTVGSVTKWFPGKKVYMQCEVTGDPHPTISWERDGEPISKFGSRFSMNKDSKGLRIFTPQVEDSGNYTCIARNQFGVDRITNTLIVMTLPDTKIVSPTNLTFMELTNQQLVCQSGGTPQPTFEWLINSNQRVRATKPVHANNSSTKRLYSIDRRVDEGIFESVLMFQPITFKDYGSFACVAYNDIGHSRVTVTLNVLFSPKVLSQHEFPQTVSWWEGNHTNLTCVVAGNDLPIITWTLDGQPFKCNNPKEIIEGAEITSSCTIIRKSDGGPGVYRCNAKNSLGKILVHEFHVREKFPPSPVEFTPISSNLDEVTLSVKVPNKEDTPPATYVLASYKLVSDDIESKTIPQYERMGDVNRKGEGTVKLVGVKENSEYIVKVRARNSVGFGPETAKIINTAVPSETTTSTSFSTFSTDVLDDNNSDDSVHFSIDNINDDEEMMTEREDENGDTNSEIDNNYPTALSVKDSDNGAEVIFGRMRYLAIGLTLSVYGCSIFR